MSARESPTVPRYLSIDILRGVAILLMIQVHFVEYLSWLDGSSAWLYDTSMLFGSVSAPLFAFLSGVSYCLWLRRQEELRRRDRDITRRTLRRGYFLFVLGLVLNFAVWLPDETFNWDILTLLGTAFLFLAVARNLPTPALVVMCVAVLLASPPLRVVGDYAGYWDDGVYSYDFTIRDILFGFVANGYFPVFPWIIFPVAGFVCGDALFRRRRTPGASHRQTAAVGLGLVAIAGLALAVGSQLPHPITLHYACAWTEFPASTVYVLATLGLTILGLVALHRLVDLKQEASGAGRLVKAITRFSAFSLTVYVLHHMVVLWPLWIYGAWTGHEDVTIFWRHAMSPPLAFALALVFIVACHFLLRGLEHVKSYSLESLMRRVCDGRAD